MTGLRKPNIKTAVGRQRTAVKGWRMAVNWMDSGSLAQTVIKERSF